MTKWTLHNGPKSRHGSAKDALHPANITSKGEGELGPTTLAGECGDVLQAIRRSRCQSCLMCRCAVLIIGRCCDAEPVDRTGGDTGLIGGRVPGKRLDRIRDGVSGTVGVFCWIWKYLSGSQHWKFNRIFLHYLGRSLGSKL